MSGMWLAGHGHVRPRADGVKARCGGPVICSVCAQEQAAFLAAQQRAERRPHEEGPPMTKTLQAAAQALLDAIEGAASPVDKVIATNDLRAAISAPPPSEEEAVKELMRLVRLYGDESYGCTRNVADAYAAVEQAVRQMLRSAQEDARDAARYRTLRTSLECTPGSSHTMMPAIRDPRNTMITYLPEALDDTLDQIIAERKETP